MTTTKHRTREIDKCSAESERESSLALSEILGRVARSEIAAWGRQ